MASIKNLKKDINYVLGDVIEYALDVSILKNEPKKGDEKDHADQFLEHICTIHISCCHAQQAANRHIAKGHE